MPGKGSVFQVVLSLHSADAWKWLKLSGVNGSAVKWLLLATALPHSAEIEIV